MTRTVNIRPFLPADLLGFVVQPAQASEAPEAADDIALALLRMCAAPVAAECADGRVRLVGGISGAGHCTMLVALFAEDAGPWMLGIVRAVRAWLADERAPRIAMEVRADFKAGRKFAEMLGFEAEGLMRARGPNREDYMLFARIAAEPARGVAA